jgi:hypothetical protein
VIEANEAGCTGSPLKVELDGEYARLTGTFGVYDPSDLSLAWKHRDGRVLQIFPLGSVHPLEMVLIDAIYPRPVGADSAELLVTSNFDAAARLLARAEVLR